MVKRFNRRKYKNTGGLNPLKRFHFSRFVTFLLVGGIVLVVLGTILTVGVFGYYATRLPSPDRLTDRDIDQSTKILDRNGNLLYEIHGDEDRTLVRLENVSPNFIDAVLATEDGEFYRHDGFDIRGFARGVVSCFTQNVCQGGSTLTQQLSKNALLSPERTITRKIKELILSLQIEQRYGKDEILQMYINEAPFGHQAWGVEAAAKIYFGKDSSDLNVAEAALLAGLPQAPTAYSPCVYPDRAKARQLTVIRLMENNGWYDRDGNRHRLSAEDAEVARNEELSFTCRFADMRAPHFVMYVREELEERYGQEVVERGGLVVTTTLDLDLHNEAQSIVREIVDESAHLNLTNGALVVMDPKTGQILTMVGSKNYYDEAGEGQFNVATARRQPGSAIKPITYATALKQGYTAGDVFFDVRTSFPGGQGQPDYVPRNYDGTYQGPVFFRDALGNSINTVAVKLLDLVSIGSMLGTANDMGIKSFGTDPDRYGLSLTLGAGEATLLEMTNAFGVFANQGEYLEPVSVLEVKSADGRTLERWQEMGGKSVLKPEESYIISHILADNNARIRAFGSNSLLNFPGYTVSVKTGTTDDIRDNWAIGYTPDIVIGSWVGNNDNSPMSSVASGISGATPIFNRVMNLYLQNAGNKEFERPDNIIEKEIDYQLGGVPQGERPRRWEVFIQGTEPNSKSSYIVELEICREDGKLASEACKEADRSTKRVFYDLRAEREAWQEDLNKWIEDRFDGDDLKRYKPPTEVSALYFDKDGKVKKEDEPEVIFKTPKNREKVDNKFKVRVEVLTPKTVTEVKFYLDGVQVGRPVTSIPYEREFEIEDSGEYEIRVDAIDSAGNKGSKTIEVEVK